MKLRHRIAGTVVVVAGLVGGVWYVYNKVLTDEARENVETTIASLRDAYEKISHLIDSTQGMETIDPDYLPNVEATKNQWAAMGY